jgi:hypothetical protein
VAEYDKEIVNFAERVLGMHEPVSEAQLAEVMCSRKLPTFRLKGTRNLSILPATKETKTAAELAQTIDDWPIRTCEVVIYRIYRN